MVMTAVLATACSGIPRRDRDQEQLDRYLRYAKPPVDQITYFGNYSGWTALSRYQLVFFTNVNDAYLITVSPPCDDLQFANRIGVTRTANTIYARFDAITVKHWRCPISEIRPVDYLKMRQDLRAEHAAEKAEKAQKSP
jgi:hypothetical protein